MPDGIRFRQHVGINQDQNRHDNGGIGYAFRTEKADKDTGGEGGCQGIAEIRAEQRCDNQAVFVPKEAVLARRLLPFFSRSCIIAGEAPVMAVSVPEKNAERISKKTTAIMAIIMGLILAG